MTRSKESTETYAWVIIIILFAAQTVMSMGAYAWGPLAPFFREEFGVSRAEIGMVTSALYITAVIVAIPAGMLVDRIGARIMLVFCIAIMAISFIVMPLVNKFFFVIVCAAVSGIGYGMINQVSTKGMMHWFTSKTRATAMGIKQSGVTLGAAISAVLLPVLTVTYSWKLSLFVVGIVMLITAFLSFIFYRERPEENVSSILPMAGAGGKSPEMSLLKILSDPTLFAAILILPLMTFNQICIASFLVLYLTEELNFSIGMAGSCLTVAMVAGTAGRVGWGIISDRVFNGDRLKPSFLLTIIGSICAFCLAVLPDHAPIFFYILLSGLIGFTLIGWNALLMTFVAELAGTERAGSVAGIGITVAWVGIIAGPPIFGYIADSLNYFTGWMLVSFAALVSALSFIYISLRRGKKK